jgi:DNA-binding SARP family transcriptional activator
MAGSPRLNGSARLRLALIRGFELKRGAQPVQLTRNAQRLVAFVALAARPQSRSTVAAALWTDATDGRAAANLRTALWKLAELRGHLVQTAGELLRMNPTVEVDVCRLLHATNGLLDPSAALCADVMTTVFDLSGDLLPDWDEEWLIFERERLRLRRIHALEALSRRLIHEERFGEAIEAALYAVAAEPLRESAQRVLIEAHLAEGNLSEARRQFALFRDVLWDEMCLQPTFSLWSLVDDPTRGRAKYSTGSRDGP